MEVVKVEYVYEVLKYGVDVFWIGVCIIVNFFLVQELVDVISGMDIFVFIKNLINFDLLLWMGVIEWIYKVGIWKIGVIYCGFFFYGEIKYCNVLCWQFVIELKCNFFDLMMICDNSYICGCWDLLQSVVQEVMDLNYDGIMMEVYLCLDEVWSDVCQQIMFDIFKDLVFSLVLCQEIIDDIEFLIYIDDLCQCIDELDDELLKLLG